MKDPRLIISVQGLTPEEYEKLAEDVERANWRTFGRLVLVDVFFLTVVVFAGLSKQEAFVAVLTVVLAWLMRWASRMQVRDWSIEMAIEITVRYTAAVEARNMVSRVMARLRELDATEGRPSVEKDE